MPAYRSRTVLEIVRGIKAFLSLEAGITRGEAPDHERRAETQRRRISQLQRSLDERNHQPGRLRGEPERPARKIAPLNIIWILGSPRTGSTWLARILRELEGHVVWDEPFFGVVLGFRDNIANKGRIAGHDFLLGDPYKEIWLESMRRLFLEVGEAKFRRIRPSDYLIVKEPNGSLSAPLIMEAFPESRLIFLTRDGRDVVASLLDAARQDTWYEPDRYETSLAEATMQGGTFAFPRHESEDEFVEQLARNYLTNTRAVERAYAAHLSGLKAQVRYEDLRHRPLECVQRTYETLGIVVDEERLGAAIEKHSWENIPESEKGEGKFHRKATPGSWKEDLTPQQIRIVERTLSPLLKEFGYV